jgi:hypothetical protein
LVTGWPSIHIFVFVGFVVEKVVDLFFSICVPVHTLLNTPLQCPAYHTITVQLVDEGGL